MEYNPYLRKPAPGGRGGVEKLDNIAWQNRAEPPGAFENGLGDALESVFSAGAQTAAEVVQRLNEDGSRDREGRAWTEESFQAEMARLGK